MNITRRSLIAGIFGAAAAPAIVRAESLMKIWVPTQGVVQHGTWGVGMAEIHRQANIERNARLREYTVRHWTEDKYGRLLYADEIATVPWKLWRADN